MVDLGALHRSEFYDSAGVEELVEDPSVAPPPGTVRHHRQDPVEAASASSAVSDCQIYISVRGDDDVQIYHDGLNPVRV